MIDTCPNCGKHISPYEAVCECGELLRAEVTHVQAWETETVFGGTTVPTPKRKPVRLIALACALAVLVIGLIGIRQNFLSSDQSISQNETAPVTAQSSAVSDIIPPDDAIQPDTNAESENGVFEFSSGQKQQQASLKTLSPNGPHASGVTTGTETLTSVDGNSLDDQLLSLNSDAATAAKDDNAKPDSDCKPKISLKRPEPPAQTAEVKPAAKSSDSNGRTYILGPRGGCFFITASGSKKYVGRSMCSQSTIAAAGRQ